jgi:hypothetical protein
MCGDHYEVQRDDVSMRIPTGDVAFVAQSLVDAYQQKRASRGQMTATGHIGLAEWCLRHSLWAEASLELVEARGKNAGHRQLELIERRLLVNSARRQPRTKKIDSISKPQSDNRTEHVVSTPELPKGALELFTRRVQPLLVNNCTGSSCHRPEGPSEFSLNRALLFGESNQKTTQHNLSAALSQVDRTSPSESPLLVVPLRPHGGLDHAIFPPHRRTLRELVVQWVTLVADQKPLPQLAEFEQPRIFLPTQLVPSQPAVQRGVMPAAHWQPPRRLGGGARVRFGASRPGQRQADVLEAAALSQQINQLAKGARQTTAASTSPETSAAASAPVPVGGATSSTPPSDPEYQPPVSREAKGD